jgi:hypothetical protein
MYIHCLLTTCDDGPVKVRTPVHLPCSAGRNSEPGLQSLQSASEAQLHVSVHMGGGRGNREARAAVGAVGAVDAVCILGAEPPSSQRESEV